MILGKILAVYDVVINEVLDLIAEDTSSEDEEKTSGLTDVPKKRARRQFGPESLKRSYFSSQCIVKVDKCIDRTSTVSIWNPLSSLGAVFRNRCRVPYEVFDCLCKEYSSEADTRLKSDNKGLASLIVLVATMRILARDDVPFDSLEELNGISRENTGYPFMDLLSG